MTENDFEEIARRAYEAEHNEQVLSRAEQRDMAIRMAFDVVENLLYHMQNPDAEPFRASFAIDGSLKEVHEGAHGVFESDLSLIRAAQAVVAAELRQEELPEVFTMEPELSTEPAAVLRYAGFTVVANYTLVRGTDQIHTIYYEAVPSKVT